MKKKHHKKPRPAKRAASHKTAKHSPHAKRTKRAKRTKHHGEHATPGPHSFSLLRAIKRRREAEHGEHPEPHGMREVGHHAHNRAARPVHKRGRHHEAEPVITEKSFEKMLAMRRFQHHTR
jgi:hypothetical protein